MSIRLLFLKKISQHNHRRKCTYILLFQVYFKEYTLKKREKKSKNNTENFISHKRGYIYFFSYSVFLKNGDLPANTVLRIFFGRFGSSPKVKKVIGTFL